MREIKFRAWDKRNKKMETRNILNNITWFTYEDVNTRLYMAQASCDYIILQYTGLKDKSGKEIYEGDILKGHDCDYPVDVLATVLFEEGSFIIKGNEKKSESEESMIFYWCNSDNIKDCEFEIIGDIYENPELLEKNDM